ncbi:MAG: SDR family oxidoreductase [Acholeplasmatales bacterium]|nr:SDR family oxidoreductase [Acholeplasmatales bacterium]
MRRICVITGGSSGMGFQAAKILGNDYQIILAARNEEKLIKATNELKKLGIDSEYQILDLSSQESIVNMVNNLKQKGNISILLNCAGMSPHMGDYKKIIDANAYGNVILNNMMLNIMKDGIIINVSSMSSYLTPAIVLPKRKYKLAFKNLEKFKKKLYNRCKLFPKNVRSGVAYGISKNFLTWFSIAFSIKAIEKNVRVIAVSPGNFSTPMGSLEEGDAKKYIDESILKRNGDPKEIAYLFKSLIDSNNSYLTGIEIKCDGGVFAYKENKKIINDIKGE